MTRATLCCCIALSLTSAVFAQPQQPPADPAVREARTLTSQGKLDEALAAYRQILEKSPDSFDANMGAGVVLDLQGKYDQARKHLTKAIDTAPSPQAKAQAMRTMAVSYAFTGDGKAAIKYEQPLYDQDLIAKEYNDAGEVADELARILLESGDVEGAKHWYRNGHDAALKDSNLKQDANDLWAFRWESAQARIAARHGDHKEAEKHVAAAKAIMDKGTLHGQEQFLPYIEGYVAFYGGDYKQAIADLQKGNQRDPFILSLMAQSYEKTGDKEQAMETYRKILGFNMHNPTNAFARPLARQKTAGRL